MAIRALQVGSVWLSERAGGGDRVFADLAKYLPSHGIGLEALVAGPTDVDRPSEARLSSFGEVTDGTSARWLGARKAITARLGTGTVDLVASHFALYASAAVGRLRRVPHIVHFHGPWAAESREEGGSRLAVLAKWSIERTVYRSAVRFIVLSEAFGRLATQEYGVPAELVRVIPGAADLDRFSIAHSRGEARRALGWPEDRRILVSVRRLVRRTGVDRLIEALPQVRAQAPDVHLYVGGTGPLRAHIERRIAELGLDDCVTLLGFVADEQLPLMYRAADLNVIPTIALEGFGLTAVEALAAGTASVVTPVGGLPEILSPLAPQLVLESTEVPAIVRGLTDALSGTVPIPSDDACRAFATERFSADLMARRVAAVYREVCA
jgi:glycogen synthase